MTYRFIILLLFLLILPSCVSLKEVIVQGDNVYTENNEFVTFLGNPRLTCFMNNNLIADGYLVRQDNDTHTITIDEFGFDYVVLSSGTCLLNSNEDVYKRID